MAVIQRASRATTDMAPLWLPNHDVAVVEQSSTRPPDHVDGYGTRDRLATMLFGSRWKIATSISTALAAAAFLVVLPSLFAAGVGTLLRLAVYQAWTIGLLLLVSMRVRTISVGATGRYWLAGFFTVALLSHGLNGLLGSLTTNPEVWTAPLVDALLVVAVLTVAVVAGRRSWRHPGLVDLMTLGFAVGAGYAFHEQALWERGAFSGFELNVGLLVPTMLQPPGMAVVGQAVWASLSGLLIGLAILHRRRPGAVVAGAIILSAVVLDRMSVHDTSGSFDDIRRLLVSGHLVAVLFLACSIAAVVLDRRRLRKVGDRDHLFPSDWAKGANIALRTERQEDPFFAVATSRYRRLRNGMHTTVAATATQWPPRSQSHAPPVGELARLGRAAELGVGPGTSAQGWAPDPESTDGSRFVGQRGFTVYVSDNNELTTSTSVPKARVEAEGVSSLQRGTDFWQLFGVGLVAVVLYGVVRLLTASEDPPASTDIVFGLAEATSSPALVLGAIGACAALISIRGRNTAQLDRGFLAGPGYDPSPDRPGECEV